MLHDVCLHCTCIGSDPQKHCLRSWQPWKASNPALEGWRPSCSKSPESAPAFVGTARGSLPLYAWGCAGHVSALMQSCADFSAAKRPVHVTQEIAATVLQRRQRNCRDRTVPLQLKWAPQLEHGRISHLLAECPEIQLMLHMSCRKRDNDSAAGRCRHVLSILQWIRQSMSRI